MDVLLRPDDVVHDDASPLKAQVLSKAFRGAEILYALRLPSGSEVLSLVPSHHDHPIGQAIGVRLATDHIVVFPRERRRSRWTEDGAKPGSRQRRLSAGQHALEDAVLVQDQVLEGGQDMDDDRPPPARRR